VQIGPGRVKIASNNNHGGKGIVNPLELIHLLSRQPVRTPKLLPSHFPELKDIVMVET
jgi:hypothetical protein